MRDPRQLATLVLVAVVALAGAGCSHAGDGGSDPAGTANAKVREKAVEFAECMRDHGVSRFPDPDASGQLTMDSVANGSSVDTSTPTFDKALQACKDLQPSGFTGRKRSTQTQKAALKFAQCVREHGVKDFPDPSEGDPLVDTNKIPSANEKGGMTILNSAMHACSDLARDAMKGQR